MKKKLLLVLMLIAAVVVMPRVHAADDVKATVTDITNTDTLKSDAHAQTLTPDENGNYTITYENDTFKIIEGTTDGDDDNRPADKAWIGFRIALPEDGATKYEIKQDGTALVAETTLPEDKTVDVYYGFDATKLTAAAAKGENLESIFTLYLYSEDGEESPVATQTIKVVVVPKGIVLQAKDYTEEEPKYEWTEETYKTNVKKVTVTVKVMKDGKEVKLEKPLSYTLPATYALSEDQVAEIQKALTDKDVDLVGLYTDEDLKNEFDPEAELTENTTVYVVYKTKVAEEEAPDTIDNAIMYIALAGASLLVASGVAIYYKRFN